MRKFATIVAALALTSCTGTLQKEIVYRDVPVEVKVPVAQPCVVGARPAAVKPLNQQYTPAQWKALDPKQKAAIVAKQGLDRATYGENVNGATVACS